VAHFASYSTGARVLSWG
jgi:hypothetical protein